MNNRQNGRRRRGGGGNTPRPMGMAQNGQAGNRLEVRVRGNAHQLLEKYKVMARDAHQAGDRVAAEYYLQHADHYFRVLNDSRIRQEEMRARRGIFDPLDEETDDEDQGQELADMREAAPGRDREPGEDRTPRSDGRRDEARRDEARRDDDRRPRPREARRFEEPAARAERPWTARPSADEGEALSDGEAALVAFGGVGDPRHRTTAPADQDAAGATAGDSPEDAPAPRRRPRTRRTTPAPAEG